MKQHQNSALSIWLMCRSNKIQGMTLTDFILAVFAILIFAAVALPTLLISNHRAMQVEAKNIVGLMNRAQYVYFEENKGVFADSIEKLGIGFKTETADHSYPIRVTDRAAFNYAISKLRSEKSYVGAVWKVPGTDGKTTTQAILCEAEKPAATKPADPVYKDGHLLCGERTKMLGQ